MPVKTNGYRLSLLGAALAALALAAGAARAQEQQPDYDGIQAVDTAPAHLPVERRAFLLAERERLRRAILGAAGTEFPVAQLIVSPERGATAEQIRGDVLNLQVAAFRLSIEKPAGVPPEKPDFGRAPAGESPYRPLSERTDGPLRHRRWVAKRAAEVHDLLARAWDPKLASEELLLEASLRYWDGRIRDALEARGLQR